MRVGDTNIAKSVATLFDADSVSNPVGTISAVSEGTWADGYHIVITTVQVPSLNDPTVIETLFNLSIFAPGTGTGFDSVHDFDFTGVAAIEIWQDVVFNDPTAVNFVEKIINGHSQIITVTMSEADDPDTTEVYTLSGGNNGTTALSASDIIGEFNPTTGVTNGLTAFADPITEEINLLSAPGFNHDRVVAVEIATICTARFDCLGVIDVPDLNTAQKMADYVLGSLGSPGNPYIGFAPLPSSNRYAIYGPWIEIFDSFNNELIFVPPSTRVLGQFAYNDSVSFPWFAAAGPNRGIIFDALDVRFRLSLGDGELVYGFGVNINPVVISIDGVTINGNKTLQRKPSLLQNIHVVRMLMYAEKVIATAARFLQWEPHDPITWRRYVNLVEPFISDIVTKRGITDFRIKCDRDTNIPFNISQGQMVAELHIIPTNSISIIVNRFIIEPAGTILDTQQVLNR